jgi:spermidine synthase
MSFHPGEKGCGKAPFMANDTGSVKRFAWLFFLSGFAGLLYQIVWVRLAMTHFGVITPVLSVIVAVFMLGLGIGSLGAGAWVRRDTRAGASVWLRRYGWTELGIGAWSLCVPVLFRWGEGTLLRLGEMNSLAYLAASALWLTAALLPACTLMGMTYPLMMAHAKEAWEDSTSSFSFLYRANVLGALCGALATAYVLVELFGFRSVNLLGVAGNTIVALAALRWAKSCRLGTGQTKEKPVAVSRPAAASKVIPALFLTGFVSMALEVVWTRNFTPLLGSTVYSFALVLAIYLASTAAGSSWYRRDLGRRRVGSFESMWLFLTGSAFLPIWLNDPRLGLGLGGIFAGLAPFCALLGYVTPRLIDQYSGGNATRAGYAYAVNIAGCVLGPLAASYAILPTVGAVAGMSILVLPLAALLGLSDGWRGLWRPRLIPCGLSLAAVAATWLQVWGYEERSPYRLRDVHVRRDYAATVLSSGRGYKKVLLVNGMGTSVLTPLTKAMAHLPALCHPGQPRRALVICFGMGTTYRSLLSWGFETTAVELVPSVRDAFGDFFDDAEAVLINPRGRILVDDGRRYLNRIDQSFDIITLDPPPPVEASGSGLLYSKEFYDCVKRRLAQDGILQQWWPKGELRIFLAVARTVRESFPYVRVFRGMGREGYHLIASRVPFGPPSLDEAVHRLPPDARKDLLEWTPDFPLKPYIHQLWMKEIPIKGLDMTSIPPITDDRPYNEYYLLRRSRDWWGGSETECVF